MCMGNVNINCLLFEDYSSDAESGITFSNVNTMIRTHSGSDNVLLVERFKILVLLNWLSDDYDELINNVLDIRVRLSSPNGLSAKLADYSAEEIKIHRSEDNVLCKNIGTLKSIITVNNLHFPYGVGTYYLKVFVRKRSKNDCSDENAKFETQFITPIEIVE